MFGVKLDVIAPFEIGLSTWGSVKNCSVPMRAKTRMSTIALEIIGTLMRRAIWRELAPSMRGGLVDARVDAPQGRVDDDHVVAGPLPDDDVEQAAEDVLRAQDLGCGLVERGEQVGERTEDRAVEEAPHERADDGGNRVGMKMASRANLRQPGGERVQHQGGRERDRHLDAGSG